MNEAYDDVDKSVRLKKFYFYRVFGAHDIVEYITERPNHVAWNEVPNEIPKIVAEIANGTLRPSGSSKGQRIWKKKSFFVYHYENPTQHLIEDDAVRFEFTGGGNHSFRDGWDVPKANGVSIFYCVNLLKMQGGSEYEEKFNVQVMHHADGHPGAKRGGPRHHID
ncbi:MAG TPA: hypothetical protein VF688_14130, partial [Allosphingosinicella sp.]